MAINRRLKLLDQEKSPFEMIKTPSKKMKRVVIAHGLDLTTHKPTRKVQTDTRFRRNFIQKGVLAKLEGRAGQVKGVPYGWRAKDYLVLKERLQPEITRLTEMIMENHVDTNEIDDTAAAKEALRACVEIMRLPGSNKDRISAAKTILEFTKKKPATSNDLTVRTAESFLDDILEQQKSEED